ncbi:MAG: hypothetical protein WA177_15785 [Xanthobacteraceae bacterium]
MSIISAPAIFLSPPRNVSSIDTGMAAASSAIHISPPATDVSAVSLSSTADSAASSGFWLNRAVTVKAPRMLPRRAVRRHTVRFILTNTSDIIVRVSGVG